MTGTTPNYGFVIPNEDGTDLMDADLWRTPIGQIDLKIKDRYDALKSMMDGGGNVSFGAPDCGPLVASPNWTLNNFQAINRYGMAMVRLQVTRTTSAIANASDGNLVNTALAQFNPSSIGGAKIKPMLTYGPLSTLDSGVIAACHVYISSPTVGQFIIAAMAPGPGIAIGDVITCGGMYATLIP